MLSGVANEESVTLLRILSLSLIPISISLFYGDLLMINLGLKVQYTVMRSFGFLIYLVFFFLLYFLNILGVVQIAILIVVVESIMTIYSYSVIKRIGHNQA